MVHLPETHQQQPRMMPKHQCRCGVLFRSVQAIKRFKNRVVDAKRSIFGTGFPSFSSHHLFEAQAAAVVSDPQHDVDDDMLLVNSMGDYDFMELEDLEEQQPPATPSPSPAVTLIQEEESSSDRTHSPHNQTSSLSTSHLIEHTSSPNDKWILPDLLEDLDLSELDNYVPALSSPDTLDEPVEGIIMSTTTLTTTSYNYTHNYGSETAPRVDSTTAYTGMMYSECVTGSKAQNYDLMSQLLMREEAFQSSQIIAPPSPRRWCVLKLIVWACKHLRFSRLTFLSVRGASQILVATASQQHLKRKREEFEGIRSRKNKESGKMWVAEIRRTTKTFGPDAGKVWLGSYLTPEEAARAYDAGKMFCSKPARSFNFPDSQSTLAPYKDWINQLPMPEQKKTIQKIAKQYGETGSVNPRHCSSSQH